MSRYSYLWGTKGKDYTEIGRSEKLDHFLRVEVGAQNTGLVLEEVMKMISDFKIDDNMMTDYLAQEERPLNIRYAPMHLYKKPQFSSNMKPFAAMSINGLEPGSKGNVQENRETYYKYLTFWERDNIVGALDGYNYLDQIFGTQILSYADVDEYRKGNIPIVFERLPEKRQAKTIEAQALSNDWNLISLVVTALYQDTDYRVVIKLKSEDNINRRGLGILEKVYSMLPPMMAFETGFAAYEKPENILSLSQNVNTRIFVISGNSNVDPEKHFLPKTLLIDLSNEIPENPDQDFVHALLYWAEMEWDKRQQAMEKLFVDYTKYFDRDYFIATTNTFRTNKFFEYEKSEYVFPEIQDTDALVSSISKLYNDYYTTYRLITQVSWGKEKYKDTFCKNLPDGIAISDIKEELTSIQERCEKNSGLTEKERQNQIKAMTLLRRWLDDLWNNPLEDQRASYEHKLERQRASYEKKLEVQNVTFSKERGRLISQHTEEIAKKEEKISQQADDFKAEREQLITKYNAEIMVKDAEIAKQAANFQAEKDELIIQHEAAIGKKNAELAQQAEAFQTEKKTLAIQYDQKIKEKDEIIEQKEAINEDQKASFEKIYNEAIARKDEETASQLMDQKIAYEDQINKKNQEIDSIETSLTAEKQARVSAEDVADKAKKDAEGFKKERDYYQSIFGSDKRKLVENLKKAKSDNKHLTDEIGKAKTEIEKLLKNHEDYKEQSAKFSKVLKIVVVGIAAVAVVALVGDGILGSFIGKKNSQISELENKLAMAETKGVKSVEIDSLFIAQPMNNSVEAESEVTFSALATDAEMYIWQQKVSDGDWENIKSVNFEDGNELTLLATEALNGAEYRCIAISSDGVSETSEVVTLTVTVPVQKIMSENPKLDMENVKEKLDVEVITENLEDYGILSLEGSYQLLAVSTNFGLQTDSYVAIFETTNKDDSDLETLSDSALFVQIKNYLVAGIGESSDVALQKLTLNVAEAIASEAGLASDNLLVTATINTTSSVELSDLFNQIDPDWLQSFKRISNDEITINKANASIQNNNGISPSTNPVAVCTVGEKEYAIYLYDDIAKVDSLISNWSDYNILVGNNNPATALVELL